MNFSDFYFTADDWGLHPKINEAILELVQKKIVRRVSILSFAPFTTYLLSDLLLIPDIQLGLHFNLLEGEVHTKEHTPKPLKLLTQKNGSSFLSKKDLLFTLLFSRQKNLLKEELMQIFKAQLDHLRFLACPISYFDGHIHVHLLPHVLAYLHPIFSKEGISFSRLPMDLKLFASTRWPVPLLALMNKRLFTKYSLYYFPFVYFPSSLYSQPKNVLINTLSKYMGHEILIHPSKENILHDSYDGSRYEEYIGLENLSQLQPTK